MFPTNVSPFGGLVKVILALVLIGLIGGLLLTDSDLTNFITNTAKAEGIRSQNEFEVRKNAIDLENYEIIQGAGAQAETERILAETRTHEKSLELDLLEKEQKIALDLEVSTFSKYLWSGMVPLIVLCFAIGIVILMVQVGRSRLIIAQTRAKQLDLWNDPAWRKLQIKRARQHELSERRRSSRNVPPRQRGEAPASWDKPQ